LLNLILDHPCFSLKPYSHFVRFYFSKLYSVLAVTIFCFLSLALFSLQSFAFDPFNPPEGVIRDDWHVVLLEGQKCGKMRSSIVREGDAVKTFENFSISMKRMGAAIPMEIKMSTIETLEGAPVELHYSIAAAAIAMEFDAHFGKDFVEVTQSQLGAERRDKYVLNELPKLAWGIYLEQRRHGIKPGVGFTLQTYDPVLNPSSTITATVTQHDYESLELLGQTVKTLRSSVDISFGGATVSTVSFLDELGFPLKIETQIAGAVFEVLRAPESFALGQDNPPEMFLSSLIELNRPLAYNSFSEIVYRIRTKDGSMLPPIPSTSVQSATTDGGSVVVSVKRPDVLDKQVAARSGDSKPEAKYLQSSVILNIDDPLIRELAEKATKDEPDSLGKAKKLRRFVLSYLTKKNLNVGFATASETARSKEGDCTEHAVLLAAFGRASGLASRVVYGLVFVPEFGGRKNVLGFHMWTQFNIAGDWIDFDATQPLDDFDPTHIALGWSALNKGAFADNLIPLAANVGNLEVDVVGATPKKF